MDTNDPTIKKTELVIEALSYAHANNLDINNEADVKKILEALDPEHSSEEDVEEFMKLLKAGNTLIEKDVERRKNLN